MTQASTSNIIEINKSATPVKITDSTGELVVKGVATAVAASVIIQSGRGVAIGISRHPFVVFGLGIVVGYFAHKYRKELITITTKTAEQSKDFIVQQQQNIKELISDVQESGQ